MEFIEQFNLLKSSIGVKDNITLTQKGEGYEIIAINGGYNINYCRPCDAFRALLCIKSGVNEVNKKGVNRFDELGFMVDLSRNAVLNMDTMKKLISFLALLGYNQLYLYMEDTYEVQNQPYFGLLRGRYSFKELQTIDKYASSLGIEAIPCIQTLAHLEGIFKWKVYGDIQDIDNIMLVNEEKTYALIDDMLSSLKSCFKTNKIHIGMDEAHNIGRGKFIDRFGYQDKMSIMSQHIDRVAKMCAQHGYTPMIWSDMFFRIAFNGEYYKDAPFNENVLKQIPNNIELVYWDYYNTDKKKYDNMIDKHLLINKNLRFAGGAWKWTGFTPHNKFSQLTSKCAIESLLEKNIKKVMVTAWGDNGGECSIFTTLPTLALYGEACYRGNVDIEDENLKQTFFALTGCSYDDFMSLDLPNEIYGKPIKDRVINPSKYLFYNDLLLGVFDTKVKEGTNEIFDLNAQRLHALALKNKPFGYVFENLSLLCEVLSVKAELGVHITEHYLEYDTDALAKDRQDILQTIQVVKEFYQEFSAQWYKENKPHGFDVQDLRIGGMLMRLQSVYDRLGKFINGDIPTIDELNEEKLPPFEEDDICHNGFVWNVTHNNL